MLLAVIGYQQRQIYKLGATMITKQETLDLLKEQEADSKERLSDKLEPIQDRLCRVDNNIEKIYGKLEDLLRLQLESK